MASAGPERAPDWMARVHRSKARFASVVSAHFCASSVHWAQAGVTSQPRRRKIAVGSLRMRGAPNTLAVNVRLGEMGVKLGGSGLLGFARGLGYTRFRESAVMGPRLHAVAIAFLAVLAGVVSTASGASNPVSPDWRVCVGETTATTDLVIKACTAIIQAAKEAKARLAI